MRCCCCGLVLCQKGSEFSQGNTIMCCSSVFKVTGKKVAVLSLVIFLSVALYARSTYLFSIETILGPFGNNQSAQTSLTAREIFSHSLYRTPDKTSQLEANVESDKPFLMDKIINPDNFEYIIRPRVTCSGREVELMICIPISCDNHAGRSVIRRTWGSYAQDPSNKAVLLFFVGSENKEWETERRWVRRSRLQEEASVYGDILQENYVDSYRNLSLKSVSILRWVKTFCPKAKYILKVDDDMYVNIPFLITTIQEFIAESSPPSAFIIGSMQVNALPKRDPSSKWYTPYSVFGEERYPNYVSGPAYLMTSAAAVLLYEATLRVARFWLEDVYITGLCARKAQVQVYDSKYFSYGKPLASGCSFRTMVSGHRFSQEEIIKIHTELYDPSLKC